MAVASESYAPSVLVSTEGLPEKDWLEYRRRGIGGSDAAAILGISPFATARDLYYDKLKIVPFDDSESNWVRSAYTHAAPCLESKAASLLRWWNDRRGQPRVSC